MENTVLPDRFMNTALLNKLGTVYKKNKLLKLSQTFANSYQIYNIINQTYWHLYKFTAILNLPYTCTAIFSSYSDRKPILAVVKEFYQLVAI